MRFRILLTAVVSVLFSSSLYAADAEGNYAIWGMGNASCHSYNKAREKDGTDEFRYYIMGYLTAYNVHQSETYSISNLQEMPDIMAWFDDFCTNNAVHSFESALANFISEHYEDRKKTLRQKNPYGR
ncbi:hypothetical protein J2T55_000726 [Methylohalomonas lacus]|uniref:Rap1a immunity protein domain-containing protein n=1 Tax=Methylohalomonas lacus TaxID=398773 RepID=A0AAE3HKP6_9GAMM|nr:hypothetical protein [Methylohalomonas lacus]MCS3902722.1 hypothetical protein [Methylohalomonas lacus]